MNTTALKSTRVWEAVLPAVVALGLAAVLGDLLILSFGESPAAVWTLLIKEHPAIVRRPVLVTDDGAVSVGFSDKQFAQRFAS